MSEAYARNDLVERNVSWLLWRAPMLAFGVGAFLTLRHGRSSGWRCSWLPASPVSSTPDAVVASTAS